MKTCRFMIAVAFLLLIAACATAPTKPVEFANEPQTPDEQAVAQVLEGLITTWNEHRVGNEQDIDKHVSYFAPDAKIHSFKILNKVVSREEHKAAILAMGQFYKVGLTKVRIRMIPPGKSHVEGELLIFDPQGRTRHSAVYDLIQREGQWFIIEQEYR